MRLAIFIIEVCRWLGCGGYVVPPGVSAGVLLDCGRWVGVDEWSGGWADKSYQTVVRVIQVGDLGPGSVDA